jgi:hypothetical protein
MSQKFSWSVAPGWYSGGPLALQKMYSIHRQGPEAQCHGLSMMGRAFGPSQIVFGYFLWGVAPGWYSGGPLALQKMYSIHQQGPTARPIPARGIAPEIHGPSHQQGPTARPIPPDQSQVFAKLNRYTSTWAYVRQAPRMGGIPQALICRIQSCIL